MVYKEVSCIHCNNSDVRKFGKVRGLQRYQCHKGCGKTFQEKYLYNARVPGIKEKIIDIAMNGGGISSNSMTSNQPR